MTKGILFGTLSTFALVTDQATKWWATKNLRGKPPRVIIQDELSGKMREAINKLPVLYREAFVLRHLQGLEYEDVAAITTVPADTVRVRAYRAREMLRESMAPNVDTFWREKAAKEKGKGRKE